MQWRETGLSRINSYKVISNTVQLIQSENCLFHLCLQRELSVISSELNICDVQLGKMNITLCGFSGGMERCIKKYPRATMKQDSMIQKM